MGGMRLGLTFLLLFLAPCLLGILFPGSARKPVGIFFWTSLGGFLLSLLLGIGVVVFFPFTAGSWGFAQPQGRLPMLGVLGFLLAVTAGVLGNAAWGLGQARRVPSDASEAARKEAHRRIGRRMWGGLLAGWVLVCGIGVCSAHVNRFLGSGGLSDDSVLVQQAMFHLRPTLEIRHLRRLPDGTLEIKVLFRGGWGFERGTQGLTLAFSKAEVISWSEPDWKVTPCSVEGAPAGEGRFSEDVPLVLRSPFPEGQVRHLSLTYTLACTGATQAVGTVKTDCDLSGLR